MNQKKEIWVERDKELDAKGENPFKATRKPRRVEITGEMYIEGDLYSKRISNGESIKTEL